MGDFCYRTANQLMMHPYKLLMGEYSLRKSLWLYLFVIGSGVLPVLLAIVMAIVMSVFGIRQPEAGRTICVIYVVVALIGVWRSGDRTIYEKGPYFTWNNLKIFFAKFIALSLAISVIGRMTGIGFMDVVKFIGSLQH